MTSNNSLYMPYGAYELKAAYQRNMLLGLLITTTFIVSILLTSWLLARGAEIAPVIPPGPADPPVESKFGPQTTMVVQRGPVHPAFADVKKPGIPVPVEDDEIGDLDVTIVTKDEMAAIVDLSYSDIGIGEGTFPADNDMVDYIPGPTEFVSTEIYPELIHRVAPDYPRFAKKAKLEGTVHVKALVMPDGSVKEAIVFKTSEVKSLDEAALRVAKKNVYKPGIQNGRPVACWVVYQVIFSLSQ